MEAEISRSLNFTTSFGHGSPETKALCSTQQSSASAFQFECFSVEEDLMIKNKLEKIGPYLDGRCIYLVGMMGSGKTTVGQILSEILGYSFVDSDKLIEEVVGGIAVADIFKLHGEKFFREKETEVLKKLSSMHGSVISTGGGAVVQPINWKYMQKGVTIFLDVPLETLALRIVTVGTACRPLLHDESGEAYVKKTGFLVLAAEGGRVWGRSAAERRQGTGKKRSIESQKNRNEYGE
ncbi:hypothetical protein Lser_V15G37170 [Lactuca serriola]